MANALIEWGAQSSFKFDMYEQYKQNYAALANL